MQVVYAVEVKGEGCRRDVMEGRQWKVEVDEKEVIKRYIKAIDKGLLKVMSKMGISTISSSGALDAVVTPINALV